MDLSLKELAHQPMYEQALVELALLAMRTHDNLQRGRPLIYGPYASLAEVNSDVVRLMMIALERLYPTTEPPHNDPPPAWLASLWEDK